MKNLFKKWGDFLSIILGPGSVIFVILTLLSLYFAYLFKDNTSFSTLLSVIGTIFAGLAGNFIKDDYTNLSGKNILEKKGRSALRNLQSINIQLCNIRKWIFNFIEKEKNKINKQNLEEVDRHITTIQLNIDSGLSDWVDIIPELKKSMEEEVKLDKKYKEAVQLYVSELFEKRRELIGSKDGKKVADLKKKINDLEKQIKDIQHERSSLLFNGNIINSDSNISLKSRRNYLAHSDGFSGGLFLEQACSNCGRIFKPDYSQGILSLGGSICPDCDKGRNIK